LPAAELSPPATSRATQVAELKAQVDEYTEIVADNEARWTTDPLTVEGERNAALKEIEQLKLAITTFSDAIIRGPELPCTDAEVKTAASTPPVNLPKGALAAETYNAALGRSTDLPSEVVAGIDASRAQLKENAVMRRAMQQAQDKVTEYWQRLQRHETDTLEQKKAILTLENQNEVLQKSQPSKLKGKELFKQKAKMISMVGRSAESPAAPAESSGAVTELVGQAQYCAII
jgi:hypothetical protein